MFVALSVIRVDAFREIRLYAAILILKNMIVVGDAFREQKFE